MDGIQWFSNRYTSVSIFVYWRAGAEAIRLLIVPGFLLPR